MYVHVQFRKGLLMIIGEMRVFLKKTLHYCIHLCSKYYLQADIVYFAIHKFFFNIKIKVSHISANGGYIFFQHNLPFHWYYCHH